MLFERTGTWRVVFCGVCMAGQLACGPGGPDGGDEMKTEDSGLVEALPPILATNAFYYYRDVGTAWRFYTGVLGFKTVADYGFAKILQVGPSSFLTLVDQNRGMHRASEPKSVTLAVVTEEVEGWWAYLSEAGVEMRSPLGTGEGRPHDGFVAVDPEGYLLEFERFNEHPENRALLPVLHRAASLHPDGGEVAPGVVTRRPQDLGVQGTVLWLYYRDLAGIQEFYSRLLGTERLVDQGWAKIFPVSASGTGFLGFVDGARGLHQATEEKAVTVSFVTPGLDDWLAHASGVVGFDLREPGARSEGDFARTFVGYDPEGYYLEWDFFTEAPSNRELLASLVRAMATDQEGR